MSETAEREMELVAGVIGGITQKKADTWTVAVTPEGSQYAKNLWTKDADLIESLSAKIGQGGAFVTNASYWTRQDGQQVRSLWIDSVADGTENLPERVATPSAATPSGSNSVVVKGSTSTEMSKDEWRRKDRAADRRACIAIAASALQHTMPSDPSEEDLSKFNERVKYLSRNWHLQVEAVRNEDESDVPF